MVDLPNEIWGHIFSLVAEDDDNDRYNDLKESSDFELECHARVLRPSIKLIRLVCRLWKQITIRSNGLYIMSIESRRKRKHFHSFSNLLKVYTKWLKKSKGCDIDLSLVSGAIGLNSFMTLEKEDLVALLELFLPHLSRVRTLVIGGNHSEDLIAMLPRDVILPKLQCLALGATRLYPPRVIHPLYFPAIAPNITHLCFHKKLLSQDYLSTISDVKSLRLTDISFGLVSEVLTSSHFPNLEFVHLELLEDDGNQVEQQLVVTHHNRFPRLLDAYIKGSRWLEVLNILGRSSLQNLVLALPVIPLNGDMSVYPPDALSCPNLTKITLRMPPAFTTKILPLCQKCPSLQIMTLNCHEGMNREIIMGGELVSCPSLQKLKIQSYTYDIHLCLLAPFNTSNLVSLKLELPSYERAPSNAWKPTMSSSMKVYLPALVELQLRSSIGEKQQAAWLRDLIMPCLKKLSLLGSNIGYLIKEWDLLTPHRRKMLEGLEHFATGMDFDLFLMTAIRRHLKNVTTLGLDFSCRPRDYFKALKLVTERKTGQGEGVRNGLFPCLSKLEIIPYDERAVDLVDALKQLVLRRKEEGLPLEKIGVASHFHPFSLKDQVWFKEHVGVFEIS